MKYINVYAKFLAVSARNALEAFDLDEFSDDEFEPFHDAPRPRLFKDLEISGKELHSRKSKSFLLHA